MSENVARISCYRNAVSTTTVRCWMVAALALLVGKPSLSFRILSSLHRNVGQRTAPNLFSKMSSSSSPPGTPKLLEVEQKFSFSDRSDLEERLRKEGFSPVKEITMVDWYFDRFVDDDDVHDLELPLVRKDHWLRYRKTLTENGNSDDNGVGQWQLKRGNKGGSGGGVTVYEEVEGIHAVEIARSVLQEQPSSASSASSAATTSTTFDGDTIPMVPISDCDVVPFARIVTLRAKWKEQQPTLTTDNTNDEGDQTVGGSNRFPNLVVDLDTTPDGFAIGEVEAVVEGEDCGIESEEAASEAAAKNDRAVARARADIQQFLAILLEDGDSASSATNRRPPMGKLEQFLSQNRPRIYVACVESGVIPEPPPCTATPTTP